MEIEKYNNQYMAYGENHLFLAQGNTLSDLVSRVFDRIPDNHSLTFNHEGHLSAEEIKELVSSLKSKVESKDTNDTTR